MTNNTTGGYTVIKQNIKPSTTVAGGTPGATAQNHTQYFGTFVANGASSVTVVEPNLGANAVIVITLKTVGGTVSVVPPTIPTVTPGTGFTVVAQASDTSTYTYLVTNFE